VLRRLNLVVRQSIWRAAASGDARGFCGALRSRRCDADSRCKPQRPAYLCWKRASKARERMPRVGLLILTTVLVLAAMPQSVVAQTGRVGVGAAAPAMAPPALPPPVAAPAVVPHAPPAPPVAAPAVGSFAPPGAGRVFSPPAAGSIPLPSLRAPSVGARAISPPAPRLNAPVGTAGIRPGVSGRGAPSTPSLIAPEASGATARSRGGHRLRHHRIARGVDPALLWDDTRACGWVWVKRPGHRRVHIYRCPNY
jgi:hypothetical protein